MTKSLGFLGRSDSTLGERVTGHLSGACQLLPLTDARVRVDASDVHWCGVRLDTLAALLIEAPLIAWPQPIAEGLAGETASDTQRRGLAFRERRALHVSALRRVATRVPTANDPARAALFAQAPALALERLSIAGIPVRPWRIAPSADAQRGCARVAVTAEAGPQLACGSFALDVELGARGARAYLCVGAATFAAARVSEHLDLGREPLELARDVPTHDGELARRALDALGLEFGCVHISDHAVALVATAIELETWDRACDGRVARALADWLQLAATTKAPHR
ncbi:MAG: hypothetical protein IT454_03785 [Planctomycetes bacterium]|nr:hypothetical protein [Planctomycetota bacterium]